MQTSNKNMEFTDTKKITISTSTKNNKTYRTYQINMNQEYIGMLINENLAEKNKEKITLYLIEKHKQHYLIKTTAETIDKSIETRITTNSTKTTSPLTLPKNEMEYIKAYDTYLETLDKINAAIDSENEQFKPAPLKASILLTIKVDEQLGLLNIALHLTNIKTKINNDFIEYIKQEYNDVIPEWLNTLITNWNDEYMKRILNKE